MKTQSLLLAGLCAALFPPFGAALQAQDASLVVAYKQQRFLQPIAAAPMLYEEPGPLSFAALVEPTAPGSIISASVDLAGGGNQPLPYFGDDGEFAFEQRFDRLNDLQAAYPDGNYTFRLNTQNDGPQALTVNLSGDVWPSAPRIANLAAFASFNPTQPFTLQWDPMVGGTTDDLILVSIYSQSSGQGFDSPGPGEPDGLNGTATSVQIPAGTFGPGAVLEAEINFVRIVDLNPSYSEAYAVYLKVTDFVGGTSGGSDLTPPALVYSIPRPAQAGVDRGSVISFTFTEPMRPGVSVAWTGVGGAEFSYTWSSDRLTLFCRHGAGLPASTRIGWTLNPAGSPTNLRDLAGNAAFSQQGEFTTAAEPPAAGSDVGLFILAKVRFYTQSGSAPDPLDRTFIVVDGEFKTLNAVTNGQYTLPNLRTTPILFGPDHSGLESEAAYVNQADLDLFFPDGNYQVILNTVHDGTQTATLTVTGDAYPNPPTVINLAAGQSIDPATAYQLNWQPMAGGLASDYMQLDIENEYGESAYTSPDYGQPGALNGTATGVTLAAHTLGPGRRYSAKLIFFRPTDTDLVSYPGAVFVGGYAAVTEFPLVSSGALTGPTLSVLPPAGTVFQLQLNGEAGVPYRVESTRFFTGWDFFSQVFVDPVTKTAVVTDPGLGISDTQRFFRVREGF